MIVYHGSTETIQTPNISFSKKYLDFGCGFYLTTVQVQAERWALRKGLRTGKKAIVTVYELSDDLSGCHLLNFVNENEAWLDFVCRCRRGETPGSQYDIIIGNVANDDVFKTVDMYFRKIWDKQKALKELRYYPQNNQICIRNQNILDCKLCFQKSYEVGTNNDRPR